MEKKIKFALAQINPKSGDIRGNTEKIIEWRDYAQKNGADIVAFPEMAVTGYCVSDLLENQNFIEANLSAIERLAESSKDIVSIVGYVDRQENKNYNAAAVIQDGEIVGSVKKTLLPSYRYFDDKRYFESSKEQKPVEIIAADYELSLGISICEDMWDQEYENKPVSNLSKKGAELILNINASPFAPGKGMKRREEIRRHISENRIPFAYLNTVGASDNGKNIIPFDGQSMAFNKKGELVKIGNQFSEDVIFFEYNPKTKDIEGPLAEVPKYHREKELYEALVMGLRDYAKKTEFSSAIESVSGGIDSCLGLVICAEAFGQGKVKAYSLPTQYNSKETKEIAKALCENLGIEFREIPIEVIYQKVSSEFSSSNHEIKKSVTKENLQARIRGLMLMTESNDSGALLVSNGNKTEMALGYATLYGDMCGGISVIGDLSKQDVYKVAKYVNELYGRDVIPNEAFELKPSAELSFGQVDPFDYVAVSPIADSLIERYDPSELKRLFRGHMLNEEKFGKYPGGESIYEKYDEKSFGQLVDETYERFRKSTFKRIQAPPIIAVSERALGYDLRETIINGWQA